MTYRVLSDRVADAQPGDLIEAREGINMAALVYAGHVEEVAEPPTADLVFNILPKAKGAGK